MPTFPANLPSVPLSLSGVRRGLPSSPGHPSSVDGSRIAREKLSLRRLGRVQSSVRPVDAANERLLALMGSANKVPICLSGYDASDRRRVVLVPGLTGIAITSLRSYNLVEPIDQLELVSVLRSPHRLGTWRAR